MRVTSKGQVTIPQEVRRRLGITPGSSVDFTLDKHGARLVRRPSDDGATIVAGMRGQPRISMSTDQILALTRDED